MNTAEGRAAQCPVPAAARDLVVGAGGFDYSDAFALRIPARDARTAEAWARPMFTPSGPILTAFAATWGFATGTQPPQDGDALGLVKVVSVGRGSTILEGEGPRYRIRIVVLTSKGRLTVATFVKGSSTLWRQLLKPVMAAHRQILPLLMERAAGLPQSIVER